MNKFKAKYEEYINLMKSIPKSMYISLEMIKCKESRVFLRVCTHRYSYASSTDERVKMFFMLEVYDVKEIWAKKIWIDSFGVSSLKKVKGTKKIPVTFECLGKSIIVQGSVYYVPTAVRLDEEGSSYEKSQMEAVQTLTITPEMYQQIKTVWESILIGGKNENFYFLIVENHDGEINVMATNGHTLTIKNTGIKCDAPFKLDSNTSTIQALLAPWWDTSLPLEIKLSEGNKDLLVCQKGRGKIWQSDLNVKAPNCRAVIPSVYAYGSMQVKMPLIPKGMHAIQFTWEKTENGKSKLHLKQEWSARKSQELDLTPWEADAEVLASKPKFPDGVNSVTWCLNRDLFCAGLQITDDKKTGVSFSVVDNQSAMQLKGNGYEFVIMPLNL